MVEKSFVLFIENPPTVALRGLTYSTLKFMRSKIKIVVCAAPEYSGYFATQTSSLELDLHRTRRSEVVTTRKRIRGIELKRALVMKIKADLTTFSSIA